jgi:hypothetical protein
MSPTNQRHKPYIPCRIPWQEEPDPNVCKKCHEPWPCTNVWIEAVAYRGRLAKTYEYLAILKMEIHQTLNQFGEFSSMNMERTLDLNPDDIPEADDRSEWDDLEVPHVEPEDLYDEDDPRIEHEVPEPSPRLD